MARMNLLIPAGIKEIEEKRRWIELPEAIQALERGVGFGWELKGRVAAPFDAGVLGGMPYTIHAPASMLEVWYRAERNGDNQRIAEIQKQIRFWGTLNPTPICVVFHGARLEEKIPELNPSRFACRTAPEDWLAMATWHVKTLKEIKTMGIEPALETLAINNFAFDGTDWLALTHHESRIGVLNDLWKIAQEAGVSTVVDLEHLYFSVLALNREDIEMHGVPVSELAHPDACPEFLEFFGFAAEQGKICWAPNLVDWKDVVARADARVYHIGGIHPPTIRITEEDGENPLCQAYIQDVLGRHHDPQVREFLAAHRGGSHGAIREDDRLLWEMTRYALLRGPEGPLHFVLEVSNQGDGGFWWWSAPTAMQDSFCTCCTMLPKFL